MKSDSTQQQQDALRLLRQAGEGLDDDIDLTEGAFALAVLDKPEVDLAPYRAHLDLLIAQARTEGKCAKLDDQLRLIRRVLVVNNKYHGDEAFFDDPRGSNLLQVIDKKMGSAVCLGIVYMHVAQALGWKMDAVDFAGHFFLQLNAPDGEVLLDPYRAGQTCSDDYLQGLLSHRDAPDLEDEADLEDEPPLHNPALSVVYSVTPVVLTKREVLLRLQNAAKRRYLAQDKIDAAITALQRMILLSPRSEDYWRELGYLQAERGSLRAAITALEVVRDLGSDYGKAEQTKDLLSQLRKQLN